MAIIEAVLMVIINVRSQRVWLLMSVVFTVWTYTTPRGVVHGVHEYRDLPDPERGQPGRPYGEGRDPAPPGGQGQPDGHHTHPAQEWCKCRCQGEGECFTYYHLVLYLNTRFHI